MHLAWSNRVHVSGTMLLLLSTVHQELFRFCYFEIRFLLFAPETAGSGISTCKMDRSTTLKIDMRDENIEVTVCKQHTPYVYCDFTALLLSVHHCYTKNRA